MTVARKYFHLNINQVDAVRGPEVVAAVELEEDEEGEEKTRDPSYVCIHLGEGGRTQGANIKTMRAKLYMYIMPSLIMTRRFRVAGVSE